MIGKRAPVGKLRSCDQNDRSVTNSRSALLLAAQFPRLRVFPGYIASMIQMQQQPFAAIEKSKADEVVVHERCQRAQYDVDEAEASVAFGDGQLRAQR